MFTVVGIVTVAGTVTMPGGALVGGRLHGGRRGGAAATWPPELAHQHPARARARLTPNSTRAPTTQTGNLRRGAATLTSNSAGAACRWRSFSDFFSASRMKDMSAPGAPLRRNGVAASLSAASSATWVCTPAMPSTARRFLRWNSSTSVTSDGVEAIVAGVLRRQAVDAPQAVAQPLHARVARAERQRLRAAGGGTPQQHVVAEPAARQIADADLALRAAEVDLRVFRRRGPRARAGANVRRSR